MTVWVQFSQRSTCPPSAAVRQRSIAVITFNWPRLTCPALAERHAAPVVAEDIRDLQLRTEHCRGRLRRRGFGAGRLAIFLRGFLLWLFGVLARMRPQVERARDF